jgi:serine protease Do
MNTGNKGDDHMDKNKTTFNAFDSGGTAEREPVAPERPTARVQPPESKYYTSPNAASRDAYASPTAATRDSYIPPETASRNPYAPSAGSSYSSGVYPGTSYTASGAYPQSDQHRTDAYHPTGVPVGVPVGTPSSGSNPAYHSAKPAKKSDSFGKKAAVAVLATVLGFSTLGLGIGFGSELGKQNLSSSAASAPSSEEEAYSDIFVYTQPKAEYEITEASVNSNSITHIVQRVSDAVVSINLSVQVQNYFNQTSELPGSGSGIIFAEDAEKIYIATNNHVIVDADKVTISLDDKTEFDANFVGSDPQSDLAVISVSRSELSTAGVSYELAEFGDSSTLQVGDEVVAIGNAMGEGKTATSGIISAINKQITVDGKTLDVIQTDAAINPGNSGGALASSDGKIIGINTAKLQASTVEGMGYSIPSNIAITILNDLKTNGSVKRPILGINGMTITNQIKERFNLPSLGVLVESVVEDSGAELGGLEAADIIVGYDGNAINNMDDLSAAIGASKVGDTVTLDIYRRASIPMQLQITLGNANSDTKF